MKSLKIIFLVLSVFPVISCTSAPSTEQKSANMLADTAPFSVGSFSAGVNRQFAFGIDQNNFSVSFEPRTNRVVIDYSIFGGGPYKLYLDNDTRNLVLKAVTQYKSDFDQKKLAVKGNHVAIYGSSPALLDWGSVPFNSSSKPVIQTGYQFEGGAPYFTLVLPQTANDLYNGLNASKVQFSAYESWFFTRDQASALADLLVQKKLQDMTDEQVAKNPVIVPDKY
jgi:hypothetical protein